jgi:hypothetical protein
MAHKYLNMKFETLVTRYKNLGYEPKGLDRDLEVATIIKWIYYTHDIYIDAMHCDVDFSKVSKGMKGFPEYLKFKGYWIWNTKESYCNKNYCDNNFDNPFDAKFDAVRGIYKALKFQKY